MTLRTGCTSRPNANCASTTEAAQAGYRQHSRCGNARAFTNLGLSPGLAAPGQPRGMPMGRSWQIDASLGSEHRPGPRPLIRDRLACLIFARAPRPARNEPQPDGSSQPVEARVVERVVERVAAKFQCNQRFRRSSPCCLYR